MADQNAGDEVRAAAANLRRGVDLTRPACDALAELLDECARLIARNKYEPPRRQYNPEPAVVAAREINKGLRA